MYPSRDLVTVEMSCVVRERVLTFIDSIVFILLTCLSICSIVYFLGRWFSFGDWETHRVSFLILTLIVMIRIANSQVRWFTLIFMRRVKPMKPRDGLKVGVVTTIVPGAESLEMLEETVRALVALDYPHDTWVLDEGDDERVRELCRRNGAFHFSRKHLADCMTDGGAFKAHSKYGNYNAWLYEIGFDRYEIITSFDPDHVPLPSFLPSVLGYFDDPRVGYVQAPQAYYNQGASFIAQGAAEETYEYYSCAQMAANKFGLPSVVGSHNTHRVTALKEVSGFAPHDADDLLIGLLYQSHGWLGVYVPRILARGLTPVDWNGYLTQQLRWARSVIDIRCRLHQLVGDGIPLIGKILSALHGVFYMQYSITTFIGLLLLAYMLVTGSAPRVISPGILPGLAVLVLSLSVCAFFRQRFYLDSMSEWGLHWRADLLRYAKWPVFLWGVWDVVVGRHVPYALTRKLKADKPSYVLLIPHLLVIVLMSTACVAGLLSGNRAPLLLYLVTAVVVMASVSLILTHRLNFPAPYDGKLLSDQWLGEVNIPRQDG